MIKRLAEKYRAFKFNFLVPESIRDFCGINRSVWEEFLGGRKQSGYSILVDGMSDLPGHMMRMGMVSNTLRKAKGHRTIWVTKKSGLNRKSRHVMRSYGGRIKKLRIYLSPLTLLGSFLEAMSIYLGLKNPADTLKITYRGVPVGDLIYDSYIRETGSATIFRKDYYLYKKITEALFMYKWYEKLIKKHNVKYIVLIHAVYNLTGVLRRVGIKHNAVVYGCWGPSTALAIRKYGSLDDIGTYVKRLSEELFNDVHRNWLDLAKDVMDGYLRDRISGGVMNIDAQRAYVGKDYYTKFELAGMLKVDINKPFVFIMAHAFPDAPHCNSWYLFKDHYDWAYNTLKYIEKLRNVNWILKEHPSNMMFNTKCTTKALCKDIYGDSLPEHIAMLPDSVSTKSVLESADGVVTGYGTIGLEASCFGIKCLLAGEAPYSGLGFTFDPRTREDYYNYLSTLFDKENTRTVDTDRAKTAAFIYFNHMSVSFGINPVISDYRTDRAEEETVYREASRLFREKPLLEDYGVRRLMDYFYNDLLLLTNSFDIYDTRESKDRD
jgi:hypothetical protein